MNTLLYDTSAVRVIYIIYRNGTLKKRNKSLLFSLKCAIMMLWLKYHLTPSFVAKYIESGKVYRMFNKSIKTFRM